MLSILTKSTKTKYEINNVTKAKIICSKHRNYEEHSFVTFSLYDPYLLHRILYIPGEGSEVIFIVPMGLQVEHEFLHSKAFLCHILLPNRDFNICSVCQILAIHRNATTLVIFRVVLLIRIFLFKVSREKVMKIWNVFERVLVISV
jgi:hypothetical protein